MPKQCKTKKFTNLILQNMRQIPLMKEKDKLNRSVPVLHTVFYFYVGSTVILLRMYKQNHDYKHNTQVLKRKLYAHINGEMNLYTCKLFTLLKEHMRNNLFHILYTCYYSYAVKEV